ncbi:MAG: hypothetical protein QXU92_00690 [Candidatus Diapherotrites archaeon]
MKGEIAEYTINLAKAFLYQQKKRQTKANKVIKDFVKKHTRAKQIKITNEVNQEINKNSLNIPRKIKVKILKEGETARIFLAKGKELENYLKNKEKNEQKTKEKEQKQEEKTTTKTENTEKEEKQKLEEKREIEKTAEAIEKKRKIK